MLKETVEISGELADRLTEAAIEQGVTLRELVIHLLLQYVDERSDLEDEVDGDENGDDDESSADEED